MVMIAFPMNSCSISFIPSFFFQEGLTALLFGMLCREGILTQWQHFSNWERVQMPW
jgi:hypothetical protein